MKEITSEIKLAVTLIEQYNDESAAKLIGNCRNKECLRNLADAIKEILVADNVNILDIKNFERDLTDEEV